MKCVEVHGLITKYVNGELVGEQLESFLEHIENCADCKEELEIYYIIMKAMQQMDDDHVPEYNFHAAFEKELEEAKKNIVKSNKKYLIKMILLEIIIVLIAIFLTMDSADFDNGYSKVVDTFNGITID